MLISYDDLISFLRGLWSPGLLLERLVQLLGGFPWYVASSEALGSRNAQKQCMCLRIIGGSAKIFFSTQKNAKPPHATSGYF